MKLNLDIIYAYLSKDYDCQKFGASSRQLHLGRPLLYESELEKDTLYITRTDALPRQLPAHRLSIICIGKQIRTEWVSQGYEILHILNSSNLVRIFNDVQRIYDLFEDWNQNLRDALEKNESFDITEFLRLGSTLFENSITVCDHNLCVILNSKVQSNPDGSISCTFQDTPTPITMEYNEKIKQVCHAERTITVPYLSSILHDSLIFYCNNLYTFGYFTGCVSIASDHRPFRECDYPLFDYYFSCFQKAFQKYMQNLSQTESEFSSALYNMYETDTVTAEEKHLFTLNPWENWVCFQLKPQQNKKSLPKDYMYAILNNFFTDCVFTALYHNQIVGLIKIKTSKEWHSDTTLQAFEDILKRMDYFGGLSNPFYDLSMLHEYRIQACYVTEQCFHSKDTPVRYMDFFENHVLPYMLNQCSSDYSMQSLYTSGLQALIAYDRKKNTDYLYTLDVYLKNEMSITKTAAALFLHRSSMMKRIEKLHQLLNSDLSDPDERLYYRICLAIIDKKHEL